MERITEDMPECDRRGHLFRYHLAAGFLDNNSIVLDAACGVGYGRKILNKYPHVQYVGVDKFVEESYGENYEFHNVDLLEWNYEYDFDVFVGFETIEHLEDYSNYIRLAQQASKWILISAPVIPTKHMNPYHLHDFESGELVDYVVNDNWYLYQAIEQPSEFSEIYIFKRN